MSVNVKQNGNLTKVANNISIVQANWNDINNTEKNTCIKNQPETLTTLEEIEANTNDNALAGAKAVKELNESLVNIIGIDAKQIYLGVNANSLTIPYKPQGVYLMPLVIVVGETIITMTITAGGNVTYITNGYSASFSDNKITVTKSSGTFVRSYLTYAMVFAPKNTLI